MTHRLLFDLMMNSANQSMHHRSRSSISSALVGRPFAPDATVGAPDAGCGGAAPAAPTAGGGASCAREGTSPSRMW